MVLQMVTGCQRADGGHPSNEVGGFDNSGTDFFLNFMVFILAGQGIYLSILSLWLVDDCKIESGLI